MQNKQNKPVISTLFDVGILIFLAWIVIYHMNRMNSAKEEIEVLRNGIIATITSIALVGTCIMQRMEQINNK